MESTTNANQKEKFEGDLKKEIKKLQVTIASVFLCMAMQPLCVLSSHALCNITERLRPAHRILSMNSANIL